MIVISIDHNDATIQRLRNSNSLFRCEKGKVSEVNYEVVHIDFEIPIRDQRGGHFPDIVEWPF
jgi:hypothetical protein